MKNVMWKGELGSNINLDTIQDRKGLYGLGPVSYLKGELLINDGKSYICKVNSDSTMFVEKTYNTSAPFFVYTNVNNWRSIKLLNTIKNIKDIEHYIESLISSYKKDAPAFTCTATLSNYRTFATCAT